MNLVKQRDIQRASESHQWLADRAGGSNDFATLLCIYQKCHERYWGAVPSDDAPLRFFLCVQ